MPDRNKSRLVRWLSLIGVLGLLLSGLTLAPQAPLAYAQEGEGGIGDPPTLDGFSLADVTDTGAVDLAAGLTVNPGSRSASRAFFLNHYRTAMPAVGWTGSFATCTPGTTSAAYRQAILDQIAYFRAMAGVPADLALSETFNAKAQRAALMMGAAQSLSHNPGPSWPCYAPEGAEAAAVSNLHYRVTFGFVPGPSDPVTAYMQDGGGNNAPVGHRRWLLYPQTQTFGTGDVDGPWQGWDTSANAIWVVDENMGGPRPGTRDGFVAWPPPGYVPYQVTYPRWSFSYPGAVFNGASVSVTRDGLPVSLFIESAGQTGLGENTIVWRMEGLGDLASWPVPSRDTRYTVTISNVGGGGPSQFVYEVVVFDPAVDGATMNITPTRGTVGSAITFNLEDFPVNSPVTATWQRPTGTIDQLPVSIVTDGEGKATGTVSVPAVPGGPGHRLIFSSGTTTASAIFEIAPRILVTPSPIARGATANVSLRGYGRQEVVRIRWRDPQGQWIQVAQVTTSNSGSANVPVVVPTWATDGNNSVRGDGTEFRQQTNTVLVQGGVSPPQAVVTPTRTTVNSWIQYTLTDFPANSPVTITWTRTTGATLAIATVQTDSNGAISDQFQAPATPGGAGQLITFASGAVSVSVPFEIAPRIKVNTVPGVRGEVIDVSLRGYARNEVVRIRWRNPQGQWIEMATVTTSATGSSNTLITVPFWAPDGNNSLRGDGTIYRQQTNVVLIEGGPFQPSDSPGPTATPTPEPTLEPSPSPTETPTEEIPETPTEEPTAEPSATPAEESNGEE